MKKLSSSFSFGGIQSVYSHASVVNNCEMTFAVFTPPNIKNPPVLWYLSGLTCSHLNVMEKGQYRKIGASARGMWTFGIDRMRIVSPRDGWPNQKAVVMASGAGRLLD